jgi:hypothetical protein
VLRNLIVAFLVIAALVSAIDIKDAIDKLSRAKPRDMKIEAGRSKERDITLKEEVGNPRSP